MVFLPAPLIICRGGGGSTQDAYRTRLNMTAGLNHAQQRENAHEHRVDLAYDGVA